MRKIELSGHTLILFESIQTMPINRYDLLNMYILKDAGIGGTAQDVFNKFKVFFQLLKEKDLPGLQIEATNIAYSINAILENTNYGHFSFLCFIKEIDEQPVADLSNETYCKELLKKVGDWLTVGTISEVGSDIKKKINKELKLFFPDKYSNVTELLYFQQLKKKVEIQLKRLIQSNPTLHEAQFMTVEKYFLGFDYPKEMRAVKGNALIEHINYFELLCTLLEENGVQKPKELTVHEFMSRIDYLEKKFKPKK